jgi:hypothetical protein
VVEHVLPISLAREVARLPLFQSTDTAVPGRVHQGAALPLLEDLARQFIMGLRHQELGMGDASLRTLCDNAYRFAQDRQRQVRDAEARNTSGTLIKFGRVQVTEEDLVQAAYAMFYYKIKEGVARTAADIQAAQRLATGPRVTDATLSTPTLEAYLLIPAQQAPKSVVELTARDGNFHLQADQRIDGVRGRETVHEGDAIKGRVYERHLDPVLISAPKGKVILDAPEGNLDHVNPTARDGVEIAPGITKNDTSLASTSWDYTKEFLRQQAEEEMRGGGMMGGMGGGAGMFPETAGFQFNFGGSGPSVSGFSPGGAGQHYSQINYPLKRATAKARQEADARFRATNARIDNFFGQMGGGDIRARVIPNGIVAQMQMHREEMIQFHARQAYERESEDFLATYEYDEEDAGEHTTAAARDSEIKRVIQDNPELGKALATQRMAKEKLQTAARLERQDSALSRDALIGHLGVQSISARNQAAAASLRQQAYGMLANANEQLNRFAAGHPELTAYTVKFMEWGGAALHAGAYVGAGIAGGPVGIAALMVVEQAICTSLEAAIELGADHAAASGRTVEEAAQFRESFVNMVGRGLMVASVIGVGKGVKAVGAAGKSSALKVKFDYTSEGAAYSLRVDPLTGTGPMHIDARNFTSATSYTATGAPRNMVQFWQLWKEKYPDTMSAGNLERVSLRRDPRAPRVDEQWVKHFPEHAEYLGEILVHHHIDHGNLVNALPKSLHGDAPGRSMFHTHLGGK